MLLNWEFIFDTSITTISQWYQFYNTEESLDAPMDIYLKYKYTLILHYYWKFTHLKSGYAKLWLPQKPYFFSLIYTKCSSCYYSIWYYILNHKNLMQYVWVTVVWGNITEFPGFYAHNFSTIKLHHYHFWSQFSFKRHK